MTEYGFLQVKATARNRIGLLGGPDLTPRIHFNPNLTPKTNAEAIAAAEALFTIANLPATLAPFLGAARKPQPGVVSPPRRFITTSESEQRITPQSPGNVIEQGPSRSKGNVEPRVSASDMQRSGITDTI